MFRRTMYGRNPTPGYRRFVAGSEAVPFEARLESTVDDGRDGIRWSCCDLKPAMLTQAAELFSEGMTVRQVAALLRISKSEAGRLRLRAVEDGLLLADEDVRLNSAEMIVQ